MRMLDELITTLEEFKIKPTFYIDRLHIYCDARTPAANLQPLLANKTDVASNKLLYQRLPAYAHFDKKLELYLPSVEQLEFLNDPKTIMGDYCIHYAELALDFEAKKMATLAALQRFFDKHYVYDKYPHKKSKKFYWANATGKNTKACNCDGDCQCEVEGSRYYAPRKSKNVLTIYQREQSKVNPKTACLHLEWRYAGIKSLKTVGLITLPQLIGFSHTDFWSNKLDLRHPNFTTLGRSSSLKSRKTSRQADYSRGKKRWDGILALQRFLQSEPDRINAFEKITTPETLNKHLKSYLNTINAKQSVRNIAQRHCVEQLR